MLRISPLLALLIVGLAFTAKAEEPSAADLMLEKITPAFQCTAEAEGQLTCQANKQCKCGFKQAAGGLPARWAWDCGIMRPRCEVTPADTSDRSYPLPPVIIERDDDNEGGE